MSKKRRRIGSIDAETDPFKYGREPHPFSWGFYDGDNYVDFWGGEGTREEQAERCTKQLMDYLCDEDNLLLYAHNGGKFDFFFMLPNLDEEMLIIDGRIAKCSLFDGRIELRDSMLILPMALKEYRKEEFDYTKNEIEVRQKYRQEILKYQRSDCIYLHEWVMRFIDEFGLNLTLAGTAFKELKKTSYIVENTFEDYDAKFRPFYFGGRVQCFEVGSFYGDHLYIDVNSAYSKSMVNNHWYGSQHIEGKKLPEKENGSWYAEIDAISYGALPYRREGEKKLFFPNGGMVRRYKVSGWEIHAGLKTDTLKIMKVHKVYRPLLTQSFDEYVARFFALKKQAEESNDPTLRTFAKLLLNSCYGKFGQDGRKFEKFCILPFGERPPIKTDKNGKVIDEGWLPYSDAPTGEVIWSRPDPQNRFFNVATAASVTGWVRAFLWEAICAADTPLYCDTDSIICKGFDGDIGKGLGQWDIEARPVEVHIAQRKMYGMRMENFSEFGPVDKTKTASKGVRLTFDEIKHGVITGENITQFRDAPAYSLKYGARFQEKGRTVNFGDLSKNLITTPEEYENYMAAKVWAGN